MITSWINRIRRNHALEHATINLVNRRYPQAQVVGMSGPLGFTLYTTLTPEEIIPAARQALGRLQAGDRALSVHRQCGTNLVVTAVLTTAATLLGARRRDRSLGERLERLPHLVLLNVLALLFARPLGEWVQATLTTDTDVDEVEIASIFTDQRGGLRRIRVHTRQV